MSARGAGEGFGAALDRRPPRRHADLSCRRFAADGGGSSDIPGLVVIVETRGRAPAGLPAARKLILRDGGRILVRPILPVDKDRLREGFARLSRASRYRRFMTPMDTLSDRQLRYFTEIDYDDHMAWVATDLDHPAHPGLGVARYIRLTEDPTTAEAAVTVLDEQQGRGIGTILLDVLAESARAHGIRRFRGYVLAENAPMMEILEGLGATVERDGALLRVDVPIPASRRGLPDTPTGRVFKSLAKHELPRFRLRYPGMPDHAGTLESDRRPRARGRPAPRAEKDAQPKRPT
jgi:GNAT superfamily N-acetyltransferase